MGLNPQLIFVESAEAASASRPSYLVSEPEKLRLTEIGSLARKVPSSASSSICSGRLGSDSAWPPRSHFFRESIFISVICELEQYLIARVDSHWIRKLGAKSDIRVPSRTGPIKLLTTKRVDGKLPVH
jgi:hypothetical protein